MNIKLSREGKGISTALQPPHTILSIPPGRLGPSLHFLVAAPASSGPEDFQYYVTTTEFTEEAILMKVQVSQPLARADLLGTSTGLGEDAHGGE